MLKIFARGFQRENACQESSARGFQRENTLFFYKLRTRRIPWP